MKGTTMKRTGTFSVLIVALVLSSCELGVNPLIFDGAPLSVNIQVNTTDTNFSYSENVNLGQVLVGIDQVVDSISVFNVTLTVKDRVSPPPNTIFNGYIYINGIKLADVEGLTLGEFATERSLFDSALANNVTINVAGLNTLKNLLKQSPLPTIQVSVEGNAVQGPLQFVLEVRLYTQVYTSP